MDDSHPRKVHIYFIHLILNHLSEWDVRFAKWKCEAMEHFRQHSAFFSGLLDTVSREMVGGFSPDVLNILESLSFQAKGSERPSVGASLMKNSDRSGLSKNEIAWLVGTL